MMSVVCNTVISKVRAVYDVFLFFLFIENKPSVLLIHSVY